jgi:SsrA-binding protein
LTSYTLLTLTAQGKTETERVLATNRAASHEYHLLERLEAGMVLTGTEVKSARDGKVSLKEAYARVMDGELFLLNAHIQPYPQGHRQNHEPVRPRKLLVHARELRKLARETTATGVTLVPLRVYLKGGRIKLELALAKGKKAHDKRDAERRREMDQEIARARGSRGAD